MTYYIAETDATAAVNNDKLWQPTKAKTLSGAKRAATMRQFFQGTTMHIARKSANGEFYRVAVKRADAIDMNAVGSWEDLY